MAIRKKDTSTNPKQMVVNQVVIKTLNRQSQDIDSWRQALKSADGGRRTKLYELYEDILLDNVLSDAIEKRIRAITNAELVFSVDDKEVDEINALMETQEWEDMLRELLLAKFWGITLLEFDYSKMFQAHSIPRTHINPKKKIITKNANEDIGFEYENDPFFLEINPQKSNGRDGFGLILKACPYVIYKRGNFGDWAQFAELFGMPLRVFKYNSYDEKTRTLLLKAGEEAGSAAYIVIPKEGDVDIKDNQSKGDGSLYDKLRKACNEEILYGVLGQSMTTVQGEKGARSLGEVHMEIQEGVHADDRRFIARILNNEILPRWEARGFPVSGGKWTFPEIGETLSLQDRIGVDERLDEIIEIEADYFYETYGIPKPANGGGKKVKKPETPPETPPEPPKQKPKPKKEKLPEKSFWKGFWNFFFEAPQVGAINGNIPTGINLFEASQFDNKALFSRVAKNKPVFDTELFIWLYANLLKAFREGWGGNAAKLADLSIDYGFTDEVAQTMMELNLFHFSAAKTLVEIQELNKIFRAAPSYSAFITEAEKLVDIFNKKWAETEYNTAFLVGESSATYYRLQKQTDLFPYWEYKTVGDEKVRYSHAKLDGLILPANDPRWKKILPPNDWNCRCYIVPRTRAEVKGINLKAMRERADEFINSKEFKKADAQGWGVNRAEMKEVFTANQMYIRKFPGKASKQLNSLTYKDYFLQTVAKLKKAAASVLPKYKGTAKGWWDNTKRIDGDAILKDYNNRNIVLTWDNFKKHTTGSYSERVKYLDEMKNTLAKPAEVWVNGKSLDNFVMINYYHDKIMVVVCRVEGGKVNQVKTWFPLTEKKDVIEKYRKGLLIKKSGETG